jgi:hypothetical protein
MSRKENYGEIEIGKCEWQFEIFQNLCLKL